MTKIGVEWQSFCSVSSHFPERVLECQLFIVSILNLGVQTEDSEPKFGDVTLWGVFMFDLDNHWSWIIYGLWEDVRNVLLSLQFIGLSPILDHSLKWRRSIISGPWKRHNSYTGGLHCRKPPNTRSRHYTTITNCWSRTFLPCTENIVKRLKGPHL